MRSTVTIWNRLLVALMAAALLYSAPAFADAPEGEPHKVCTIEGFSSFLEQFAELPFSDQVTCMRFPLRDRRHGIISDEHRFLEAFGDVKLVYSARDMVSAGARASILFFDIGKDSTAARDIYGYFVEHPTPTRKKVTLTEGGTFELSTTVFEWNGKQWQVIEYGDENEEYQH